MAKRKRPRLEDLDKEISKLGSLIRRLSVEIASVRTRISDLEQWDVTVVVAGKKGGKKGKHPKKKKKKRRTSRSNRR